VAAAIGGPLVFAMGAYTVSAISAGVASIPLLVTFIALNAPIIAIVAAIALLSAGVVYAYNHWGWFRNAVNAAGTDLKAFAGWLGKEVPPIWRGFTKDISDAWTGLKNFGSWISNTFGPMLKGMSDAVQKAGGALNALNPFAKHSPSLVENVQAGTAIIAGHYQTMARSVQGSMSTANVGSFAGPGVSGGSGLASSKAEQILEQILDALKNPKTGNQFNLALHGAAAVNDPEGVRRMLQRMALLGTAT